MAAVLYLIEREYYPLAVEKTSRPVGTGSGDMEKEASFSRSPAADDSSDFPAAKKSIDAGKTGGNASGFSDTGTAKSAAKEDEVTAGKSAWKKQGKTKNQGKPAAGRSPVKREEDTGSALPSGIPLARGLAELMEEERRQMEELADDAAPGSADKSPADGKQAILPRHMESYRYFHLDSLRNSVKVSRAVLAKAEKLLQEGEIKDIDVRIGYPTRQPWDDDVRDDMIGMASAYFDSGYARTSLVFDADQIRDEQCSYWKCRGTKYDRYMRQKPELCQHSAALLLKLLEYLERENPGDATSAHGMQLLDHAGQGEILLSDKENFEAPAVQIQPVVEIPAFSRDEDCIPSVSFRAGTSRMYKIRKIENFVEAVQAGQEMKFGTKTMIRLGEGLLTKDSLVWYRFMKDALREEKQRNLALDPYTARGYSSRYSGYSVGVQILDAVPLYGAALDSFYKEAEGQRLEFSLRVHDENGYGHRTDGKKKLELLLCERPLDIQVEISPYYAGVIPASGGGRRNNTAGSTDSENSASAGILQGIRITGEVPRLIEGREASYFVDEKNEMFCRVDRAQVEKLAPILAAARGGALDARIGRRNLREFYQRALPRLREAVDVVEYDKDIIAAYLPPDPVFVFYFDIEEGIIMCRPDVHYGMQVHTILDLLPDLPWSGRPAAYRDMEKEHQALDIILKYIPQVFVELRVLAMDKSDEEGLFNLLAYGLEELLGFGEVRMTEAFRRLGLRRHVKFSVGVSVESNLMDLQILSEDISEEELLAVFYQYQKKRKFVRLKNGDFLQLEENETIEQLLEIMETMGVSLKEFVRGKMQVPAYRALYLDKMLEQMQDVYTDRDRRFKALIKEFKTVEDADFEVPASLCGTLRKYQTAGYRWLRTLAQYGFGGILADEMGLGKTLQVIAVLLADREERAAALRPAAGTVQGGAEQALLPGQNGTPLPAENGTLLPAENGTLLPAENETLLPAEKGTLLPVENETLPPGENGSLLPAVDDSGTAAGELSVQSVEHLPSLVVCPASLIYNWGEELRRFAPQLKACLVAGTKKERALIISRWREYDVLVTSYDLLKRDINEYEGKTFRFEVIDEAQYIKNHSTAAAKSVKLVKAGTRFALTGTPIENRLSELWSIFDYLMPGFLYTYARFHTDFEQPIVKFEDEAALERLRRMVTPFILRRRKEDVLRDLPDKLEEVRYAGMESRQKKLYDGQVVRMKKSMKGKSEQDFRRSRIEILAELTRIRQICCDPSLILENYEGGSAKREACMGLVHGVIEGEHKALIFSQFAAMLELLEEDLKKEGIAYYKITGATPKERRVEMVNAFNSDDTPVFLISLKAGGTGLNLTGADVVIHYDPWWNVAAQNQATDRAHRIGQTRVVTVYRIIAKDTIEERILEMQESKKKLAEDILSGDAAASSTLSREELLELLG